MGETVTKAAAGHTPGPWGAKPYGMIEDARGQVIALTREPVAGRHDPIFGSRERQANDRLIAAAPCLLAALREMRALYTSVALNGGATAEGVIAACASADAALARATGEAA